ncbi:MAG: exodeoxyribonuclease III [Candidatus Dojkabacteria bacterium]
MKIYSWNVNSLRSCENKFLQFLKEYEPDIVCIQELRANPDQISFFLKFVDGYHCLFNDSGRPGYAGTALYYKDTLDVQEITKTTGNEILDTEGRVIKIKVGDTTLFNFYTPNGSASDIRLRFKLSYYSEILKMVKGLVEKGEKVIVGGDLNVGHTHKDLYLKDCKTSGFLPEERKWFDDMLDIGFVDSFRIFQKEGGYYTWWHLRDPKRERNNGWRFDYFLVSENMKDMVNSAGILKDVYGSDHCPIWVEIV